MQGFLFACFRDLDVRKFTLVGVELELREDTTYLDRMIQNSSNDDLDIKKQLQKFDTAPLYTVTTHGRKLMQWV